ncbi:hypothetical protein Ancab_027770 [Ancistrocladus abbreviatus]
MLENNDLRTLLRSFQVDMRDFLNVPNGSSKQPLALSERLDSDLSHSPLGGKTLQPVLNTYCEQFGACSDGVMGLFHFCLWFA